MKHNEIIAALEALGRNIPKVAEQLGPIGVAGYRACIKDAVDEIKFRAALSVTEPQS